MLGQLPEVQMVLSWYLSTRDRSWVYLDPVGSFTLSHLGLDFGGCMDVARLSLIAIQAANIRTNQRLIIA